jgi:hypothetical protein
MSSTASIALATIVTVLYGGVAILQAVKHNYPLAVAYLSWAIANAAITWTMK